MKDFINSHSLYRVDTITMNSLLAQSKEKLDTLMTTNPKTDHHPWDWIEGEMN